MAIIKKINIKESAIQEAFFEWLALYKGMRSYGFAIPTGGSRNVIEACNLKRQGVTMGVPDLFLAYPSSGYYGLFIELKSASGRLSYAQKEWIERLNNKGYLAVVAYSLDEAINIVKNYIEGKVNV